jgi:hypothetical protein
MIPVVGARTEPSDLSLHAEVTGLFEATKKRMPGFKARVDEGGNCGAPRNARGASHSRSGTQLFGAATKLATSPPHSDVPWRPFLQP